MNHRENETTSVTRRDFVKTSAATIGASAALSVPRFAYAAGADTIRVGMIGCGGRGTGAANDILNAAQGIEIFAMGDLFPDRIDRSRTELQKAGARFNVGDRVFTGFDAYKGVIASGADLIILATPPGFRPVHIAAVVEAGKHLFTEKPVAVDPVGVRSVIKSAELAAQNGTAIVAGTQRRHDPKYLEAMRRIHGGAIGDLVSGQVYWNQGGLWHVERKAGMSDMEWHIRNWLYFTWLSGDHIVEQHIHNLDIANWAMGSPPARANGVGGRQVRVDPSFGHIFDHFAIELEYPNGARVMSMCRQQNGTSRFVGEHFIGTRGTSDGQTWVRGAQEWRWQAQAQEVNPYVQEHADLVASIRAGKPLNEGKQVAESTLTAILAREAAYTGQSITWEEIMASDLDLTPGPLAFGAVPFPPVAEPGITKLSRSAFRHTRETAGGR